MLILVCMLALHTRNLSMRKTCIHHARISTRSPKKTQKGPESPTPPSQGQVRWSGKRQLLLARQACQIKTFHQFRWSVGSTTAHQLSCLSMTSEDKVSCIDTVLLPTFDIPDISSNQLMWTYSTQSLYNRILLHAWISRSLCEALPSHNNFVLVTSLAWL